MNQTKYLLLYGGFLLVIGSVLGLDGSNSEQGIVLTSSSTKFDAAPEACSSEFGTSHVASISSSGDLEAIKRIFGKHGSSQTCAWIVSPGLNSNSISAGAACYNGDRKNAVVTWNVLENSGSMPDLPVFCYIKGNAQRMSQRSLLNYPDARNFSGGVPLASDVTKRLQIRVDLQGGHSALELPSGQALSGLFVQSIVYWMLNYAPENQLFKGAIATSDTGFESFEGDIPGGAGSTRTGVVTLRFANVTGQETRTSADEYINNLITAFEGAIITPGSNRSLGDGFGGDGVAPDTEFNTTSGNLGRALLDLSNLGNLRDFMEDYAINNPGGFFPQSSQYPSWFSYITGVQMENLDSFSSALTLTANFILCAASMLICFMAW